MVFRSFSLRKQPVAGSRRLEGAAAPKASSVTLHVQSISGEGITLKLPEAAGLREGVFWVLSRFSMIFLEWVFYVFVLE